MNAVETDNYCRITKAQAKKLYEAGGKVYILSCKLHPENVYERPVLLGLQTCDKETGEVVADNRISFKAAVRTYEVYNCDSERGRYAAFYKKKL